MDINEHIIRYSPVEKILLSATREPSRKSSTADRWPTDSMGKFIHGICTRGCESKLDEARRACKIARGEADAPHCGKAAAALRRCLQEILDRFSADRAMHEINSAVGRAVKARKDDVDRANADVDRAVDMRKRVMEKADAEVKKADAEVKKAKEERQRVIDRTRADLKKALQARKRALDEYGYGD
jgi:hypothetical protein